MLLGALAPLARNRTPLTLTDVDTPDPGPGQVRLRLTVCGVCHTELDEIEGRLPPAFLPLIPGHQAVGVVDRVGPDCPGAPGPGDRVGVAWIFSACGTCRLCAAGTENLCPDFVATGRDVHGGYAEYMVAPAGFVHPIPGSLGDDEAAPLLCAGAIGYRSLRLACVENGALIGLTGFGASGHLVLKLIRHLMPDAQAFVFARSAAQRDFARDLGAVWAGPIGARAPVPLHAIIDTTPAWSPVVEALANLAPGGRLVVNAIRKEAEDLDALLRLDYPTHLWMEKEVKSVANVTRHDVSEFLAIAGRADFRPTIREYALSDANRALCDLKDAGTRGASVLRIR